MVVTDLSKSFHPVPKVKTAKKNVKTSIRKRSNKLAKLEQKRFSIITDDFEHCYLCDRYLNPYEVNKHEAFFGRGNREQSMRYGLVVPLCDNCHTKGNMSVHKNFFADIKIKQIAQKAFEDKFGHDVFMAVFKKNYL